jgi:hypothetical protein
MALSPFDHALLRRTALYTLLAQALAVGVAVTTDEPGSSLGARAARLCIFTPPLAALAVALALSQARRAGELSALEALGARPIRIALGALLAAWLVGVVGTACLLLPGVDPRSLFPIIGESEPWTLNDARLWSQVHGVSVGIDGKLAFHTPTVAPAYAFESRGTRSRSSRANAESARVCRAAGVRTAQAESTVDATISAR